MRIFLPVALAAVGVSAQGQLRGSTPADPTRTAAAKKEEGRVLDTASTRGNENIEAPSVEPVVEGGSDAYNSSAAFSTTTTGIWDMDPFDGRVCKRDHANCLTDAECCSDRCGHTHHCVKVYVKDPALGAGLPNDISADAIATADLEENEGGNSAAVAPNTTTDWDIAVDEVADEDGNSTATTPVTSTTTRIGCKIGRANCRADAECCSGRCARTHRCKNTM
jgi:hypothetical protein